MKPFSAVLGGRQPAVAAGPRGADRAKRLTLSQRPRGRTWYRGAALRAHLDPFAVAHTIDQKLFRNLIDTLQEEDVVFRLQPLKTKEERRWFRNFLRHEVERPGAVWLRQAVEEDREYLGR